MRAQCLRARTLSREEPCLHAKAMESRVALDVAAKLVRAHPGAVQRPLERALAELLMVYDTMRVYPLDMGETGVRALQRHMLLFIGAWRATGYRFYPKHHFAYHLCERARFQGNPRGYHTFADESENRRMSKARSAFMHP